MRSVITVVVIALAVIFAGGVINIGGAPVFARMDRVIKTGVFMNLHRSCFFFLYRGERSMESGVGRTKSEVDEFNKRPIGIDRKGEYKRLDDAASN
jgi:hypothetical protein